MSQSPRVRITVSEGTSVILEKEFAEFPISFGRNPSSQIILPFEFISRAHCTIIEEDDGLYLIDMHSSHGIMVKGERVEKVSLKIDTTFNIKNLSIKVELLSEKRDEDISVTAPPEIPQLLREKTPAPLPKGVRAAGPAAVPSPKMRSEESFSYSSEHSLSHPEIFGRVPMVAKDIRPQLYGAHPSAVQAQFRKVEAVVSWHDVIYDIQEFDPADKITLGPLGKADIAVPIFRRSMVVAKVGKDRTKCFALKDHKVTVVKGQTTLNTTDLIERNILQQKGQKVAWSFDPTDVTTMDFGNEVKLHLRYVPGTKALSRAKIIEPDETFKQSIIGSGILHVALALIIFFMSPSAQKGPKLKNVPERYARLLIQKPKPKPTPPPPPKQEVAKKEPPKPVEKVVKKQVPIKTPKVLAKKNKYPMEVKHPIAKAPPPVKVEALGALGALGAISKTANPNVVTNININPNAGGLPQKAINTGGIAGALPSSNGKLAAGGGAAVKTKGFGYGTGTGYGMQGLKGTAGTRGVAGAVVGEPKLAAMAKVEGLSRAQVMAILKQYMSEVQHCYEKNLLANPDLAGRIDFEWDIAPGGKVTDVRVKRSTVNNGDGLVECVRKIFFAMPFPKAKNGMITTPSIGFPFGRL